VALRAEHPSWGPRKLRARLQMTDGMTRWPAASTIGEILRRHGLVIARRRRVTTPADMSPFGNCAGPNDTWCIDFKGWFRDKRCLQPLSAALSGGSPC
jgi:putative transposase